LSAFTFSVYDPKLSKDIAFRKQIPVELAYALTFHKAQGMTLPRLEVDCRNMWQPGQVGVAVGRATNKAGLRVVNFVERQSRPHPASVIEFEERPSMRPLHDVSCCQSEVSCEVPKHECAQNLPLQTQDVMTEDNLLSDEFLQVMEDGHN
jgi:hypothetical protein